MNSGEIVGAVILGLIITLSGAFRLRSLRKHEDARLARREAYKRRHHFRGSLDMELDPGLDRLPPPKTSDQPPPQGGS